MVQNYETGPRPEFPTFGIEKPNANEGAKKRRILKPVIISISASAACVALSYFGYSFYQKKQQDEISARNRAVLDRVGTKGITLYNKTGNNIASNGVVNDRALQGDSSHVVDKIIITLGNMINDAKAMRVKINNFKNTKSKYASAFANDIIYEFNYDEGKPGFMAAGLFVYQVEEKIKTEERNLEKQLENIKTVASTNQLENHVTYREMMNGLAYDNTGSLREASYPMPTLQDATVLTASANDLRTAMNQAASYQNVPDRRVDSIINNARTRTVGPVARSFNDSCSRFVARYGKRNLEKVAMENGFSDLLP